MRWMRENKDLMRGEGKEVFGGLGQIKKRQKEGLSKKGKKRKECFGCGIRWIVEQSHSWHKIWFRLQPII